MSARLLAVAGGVAGALLAAQVAARSAAKPHSPPRRRRQLPNRRGSRHDASQGGGAEEEPPLAAPPAAPALAPVAQRLLLLQTWLSLAAVLWANRLRPEGYSTQQWQQLVTAGAVALAAATFALCALAVLLARRKRAAAAAAVLATAAAPIGPPAPAAVPLQDIGGLWIKDKAASDSMEPACDAMRLGGLVRAAVRLIRGLELRLEGGQFSMAVLSGVLWFRVTERYPLDGGAVQCRRRDLRRGRHTGSVAPCPATGALVLRLEWGEPLGGRGVDTFRLVAPGVLHVRTELDISGSGRVSYTQVYRRKG